MNITKKKRKIVNSTYTSFLRKQLQLHCQLDQDEHKRSNEFVRFFQNIIITVKV